MDPTVFYKKKTFGTYFLKIDFRKLFSKNHYRDGITFCMFLFSISSHCSLLLNLARLSPFIF